MLHYALMSGFVSLAKQGAVGNGTTAAINTWSIFLRGILSGSVRLRLGDTFDRPSDMIVLPCSTDGTVTPFVAERLLQYTIPKPKGKMRLGEVDAVAFVGAENISQFVAFACSVENMKTNEEAIEDIGRQIGEFSNQNPSVRDIAAPLLGAGAGGLPSELSVAAISRGFKRSAAKHATLTVHILHKVVYQRFLDKKSTTEGTALVSSSHGPARVFISYTGTNTRHNDWVAELGSFLRENGVNARLDQWHLRRGMDLPQWMTNELDLAERVIIVSDSRYSDRADGRSGGVGWETMIIQGDMSNLPPDSTKYIVIVREDDFDIGVPRYLKTKYCMHWGTRADDEALKNELLQELYDIPKEPPIGLPPTLEY